MAEYGKLLEIRSTTMKSNNDLFEADTRSLHRKWVIFIAACVVVCVLASAVSVAAAVVSYKAWSAKDAWPLNAVSGTSGSYMDPQQGSPTTYTHAQRLNDIKAPKEQKTHAPFSSTANSDTAEAVTVASQLSDADEFDTIDNDRVVSEEEEEDDEDESVFVDKYDREVAIETTLDVEDDVEYDDIDSFEVLEGENDEGEEDLDGSGASGAGELETGSGAVGQNRDGNSQLKTKSRVTRSAAKPKNKNKKKGNKNANKMTELITALEARLAAMNASLFRELNERLAAMNASFYGYLKERLAVLDDTFYQADRPSAHTGTTGLKAAHFDSWKEDRSVTEKQALRIFKAASWVEDASSPVTYSNENGQARVKEAGLYLVYAMCSSDGNKTDKGVSIQAKRGKDVIKRFHCQNGVYQASGAVTSLQSCFLQGVVMLNATDVIEINGRPADIVAGHGTYFGVIQLSRRLAS